MRAVTICVDIVATPNTMMSKAAFFSEILLEFIPHQINGNKRRIDRAEDQSCKAVNPIGNANKPTNKENRMIC